MAPFKLQKFMVIGHRGSGMNMLNSTDVRLKAIKENSILSFNEAGKSGVDFVEFDVQVGNGVFPPLHLLYFGFRVLRGIRRLGPDGVFLLFLFLFNWFGFEEEQG